MASGTPTPYDGLPESAFWRSAVASISPFDISGLWSPKANLLPSHKVSTFGSCFAQHIGRSLRDRDYNWLITETAPFGMNEASQAEFNYGVFTCRTANIYTASLLAQWTAWASGADHPREAWTAGDRVIDPFRPRIEPGGFADFDEMIASREAAIAAFRRAIVGSDVFVFTLGLTESWFDREGGFEYPMCPGTAGGSFDAERHVFRNQDFGFVREKLVEAFAAMRVLNPKLRVILTVSPVPLTATASGRHVVVATMESKSILRAVAGDLARAFDHIDYFPSYEIINSPAFRGMFFEPNMRGVNPHGVDFVMDAFFAGLHKAFGAPKQTPAPDGKAKAKARTAADVVCEEALLEAFG